jgi:hypothetical protein
MVAVKEMFMSHFSRVKTRIKNREILIQCLQERGYTVQIGGSLKGYQHEKSVDLAIQLEKGYGVGFTLNTDGSYDIVADWWGIKDSRKNRLIKDLEARVCQIQQEYALKTTLEQTRQQGYSVVEKQVEKDGRIRIVLRRWE